MPSLTKRQKRARQQLKNSVNGRFQKLIRIEESNSIEISNDSEITTGEQDDLEILATPEVTEPIEMTKVTKEAVQPHFPIEWNQSKYTSSRGKYWGTSRTSKYCRDNQAAKKKKGSHEITDFFNKVLDGDNNGLERSSPLMTI